MAGGCWDVMVRSLYPIWTDHFSLVLCCVLLSTRFPLPTFSQRPEKCNRAPLDYYVISDMLVFMLAFRTINIQ